MALSDVSIVSMCSEDIVPVVALWQDTEGVRLLEGEDAKSLGVLLAEQPGRSFVARTSDGKLVGAVCGGTVGAVGIIRHLAVATALRQRGIGTALVDACVNALAQSAVSRIVVFVRPDNPSAAQFWNDRRWSQNQHYICLEKKLIKRH